MVDRFTGTRPVSRRSRNEERKPFPPDAPYQKPQTRGEANTPSLPRPFRPCLRLQVLPPQTHVHRGGGHRGPRPYQGVDPPRSCSEEPGVIPSAGVSTGGRRPTKSYRCPRVWTSFLPVYVLPGGVLSGRELVGDSNLKG